MLGLAFGKWIRIGVALAVLIGLAWSHAWMYRAGRSAEQASFAQRLNQENENAGNAAEDWRARYRRCVEHGGLYAFDTGTCDR